MPEPQNPAEQQASETATGIIDPTDNSIPGEEETDASGSFIIVEVGASARGLEAIVRGVLDTLVPFEKEVRDQEGRWHLLRVCPYRTPDHRIDGAVLQLLDPGELKKTLDEVRRARDCAQAIVDTVRQPLVVIDRSFTVKNANRSFQEFFRLDTPSAVGRNLLDLMESAFAPAFREKLIRLLNAGTRFEDVEIEQTLEKIGRQYLSVSARILQLASDPGLTLLAFENITERKHAAEARYRRLFESARDGIVIVNAVSGEIEDVNPYLEQLLGYSSEKLIGKPFWDTEPFRRAAHGPGLLARIREQSLVQIPDLALATKDGRSLQVEMIANLYTESNREVIQFNLRDLTERRKFESELQHTDRLESLGILAGGIAHDFNNLLTGILGNSSLIYSELQTGDRNRPLLREIMQACETAAHLTRQMLAYSGQGRFLVKKVNVSDLLRDSIGLLRKTVPNTIEIRLHLNDNVPDIDADEGQIHQLLMNLVENAAEAIGEGIPGRIEISTGLHELSAESATRNYPSDQLTPGCYVAIEIRDTGRGIDESTRARIFDPFFTTKFTGRGLGLAAAHGIVRGHKGAIWVYSERGQGALFRVLLPAPQSAKEPNRSPASTTKNGGTILVVEDEDTVKTLARSVLERAGFGVVIAENGLAGLEALKSRGDQIRMVLLDLTMPVMGGEEALDRMRAVCPNMPVVVMTGFDCTEASRRLAKRRLHGFLQKPFTAEQLRKAIHSALTA